MNVEYFEDEAGQWRYRIKAANGEIMVSSEGYTTRIHAERGFRDLLEAIFKTAVEELTYR